MVMMYLVRQSVNAALHLAAGAVVGALAVVALERALRRGRNEFEAAEPPPVSPVPEPGPVPPDPTLGP